MTQSNIIKRLLYSIGMTLVFFLIQLIYGNATEWYFYLLFFVLIYSLVSSKLWKNKIAPWVKEKDSKTKSKNNNN